MSISIPTPSLNLRFGSLDSGASRFLVTAMFTPSHAGTAERLLASLRKLSLPYALFEVPSVHRSISPKGTDDPSYTKASLITHILRETGKHVLYLDSDTVVRRVPTLIPLLIEKHCDFAIMNWLAGAPNEAYVPADQKPPKPGQPDFRKLFIYSHSIDLVAPNQLICSGAAQLWGHTPAAHALLAGWQQTILTQPGVPDDQCLDFAFNNNIGGSATALHPYWLPKSYARYAWWIFDEPIIDHPDFPFSGAGLPQITDPAGRMRVYLDRATKRDGQGVFPRDCVLDTTTGNLYRIDGSTLKPAGRCTKRTWLPPQP